ncbi:hypothetical protein DPMN_035891 [Dreissena polymorpha]|uniref:Uncharacterized protein n=1 Tax=Dreissena polymorpha TaxID=45954 RepID=A0A9D4RKZ4_DREPO|nr:hypothetical protein DPMN_035891 [Dreissena polymorpha]
MVVANALEESKYFTMGNGELSALKDLKGWDTSLCKSSPWNETECDDGNVATVACKVRAQASNVTTTKNSSLQLTCGGAEDDVSECGRIFSRFHACRLEITKEM